MKKILIEESIPQIAKILKEIPLKTRLKVSNEMAFIELITELGYRQNKYWTDAENELLSKLLKAALRHTEHQLEQIEEWEKDGRPMPNIVMNVQASVATDDDSSNQADKIK